MSLNLVPNKRPSLVIETSPILLPSSNQTPAVKKCWDWLQIQLPKTYHLFKNQCTNTRWKIQNLQYDKTKGSKPLIFTKIALCGQSLDPKTKTLHYHVVYFYTLSQSILYKQMITNNDPITSSSCLLKPIKSKLTTNMPRLIFDHFQTIFNDECECVMTKNGHCFVSVKKK